MKRSCIIVFIFSFFVFSCSMNKRKIKFAPIGHFSTNYDMNSGAPRQGMLAPESKAVITLKNKYAAGLHDLDRFEYIFVLYYFNQAEGWEPELVPPESKHEFGVFATRSPRRPNPIGLSLVKLDSIEGNKLFISNVDAFDKTPVLDIKPFLPSVDCVNSLKNKKAEIDLGHHDEVFINDSLVKVFVKGESPFKPDRKKVKDDKK